MLPMTLSLGTAADPKVVRDYLGTGDESSEGSGDEEPLIDRQRVTALRAGAAQPTIAELITHFFLFSDVTGVIKAKDGTSIGGNTYVLLNRGKYKWLSRRKTSPRP